MSEARSEQPTERPDVPSQPDDRDGDFGRRVDWQSEAVQMEAAEFHSFGWPEIHHAEKRDGMVSPLLE